MGHADDTPPDLKASNRRQRPRPQRVLVVDDNEEIRQLWRACLTHAGFVVTEASNGADAVAQAAEDAPDVILMDFCMPVMNGADAARAIRRNAPTSAIALIGLTANGTNPAHEFCRVCDTVLEKPVSPEELLDALRHALSTPSSARSHPAP